MIDAQGNFIGPAPTTWEVVEIDRTVPLSDEAACAVAMVGCIGLAYTNYHLTTLTADSKHPLSRPEARPY